MRRHPEAEGPKGPVLLELCRGLGDDLDRLDELADADLYWRIVFAVRLRYSTHDFSARLAPEFDDAATRVLRRLGEEPFSGPRLRSPQARFSEDGTIHDITIENYPPGSAMGMVEKPAGALWTASYLADGRSAWERLEQAEFSHRTRTVFSVHFAEAETSVYTINSLLDFQNLVSRYPNPLPDGRVGVRWDIAARDFDAVHLTARGLVTAHDVEAVTPFGSAMLRGWESESTAWLRRPPSAAVVHHSGYPGPPGAARPA